MKPVAFEASGCITRPKADPPNFLIPAAWSQLSWPHKDSAGGQRPGKPGPLVAREPHQCLERPPSFEIPRCKILRIRFLTAMANKSGRARKG